MKFSRQIIFLTAVTAAFAASNISHAAGLVVFEAESGAPGTNFVVASSSGVSYISNTNNNTSTTVPGIPGRVASYNLTFPAAGTYDLYVRVRVGAGGASDDSFFYANGFGAKNPATASNWILCNNVWNIGFTNASNIVNGGGSIETNAWKWIDVSLFNGGASPINFTVTAGNLTQTFQIGGREDGLDFDKLAFGTTGTSFTVSNLDTGTLPFVFTLTNSFVGPDGIALHRFNPLNSGLNLDGANPVAGLVLSGNVLCGTTLNGGVAGAGTVFYVSLDGTNFNAFRSFTNAPDAGNAAGDLVISGGNVFGATVGGGSNGVGAAFLVNTNGNLSIVKNFSVVSADNATNSGGASPGASLALSAGMLYGAATAGGAAANGTVFSLSTNGSVFAVLYDFSALDSNTGTNADGALPSGGVVLSGDTLFGAASAGGAGGAGVIFSVKTNGGNFSTLHHFTPMDSVTATNSDGAIPLGGLFVANGMIYGTAAAGGTGGKGVIFSVGTNGNNFTVLHHFSATDSLTGTNSEGASPCAALTLSSNFLYGTASDGGASASGTIFRVSTNGAQFQTIYSFTIVDPTTGTNRYGAFPVAGVLPLGNALYCTASGGGPGAAGTVFAVPLPLPPAVVTNIARNLNGSVTLSFAGSANSTNVIQTVTNLTSSAWQNVSTNKADAGGAWQFTDTNAPQFPARFYRSFSF